ncbi:alanine racemase [Brachybacterium muris]|uniref:alanine racemase n=1 Tax=Brachybacterium muris TaxID=219301 RepID=UPI00195CF052|nr:alanine racemase [Brachybacterium muris]MBM7501568.1 alanine racemase [Brachybacterium muris]MCT1430978.1 alanine racemase [Brachybacterium muris]MCT2296157.1 alanine racemase [Brachybacterium muris]
MSVPIPAEDPRQIPNRAVVDPSAITDNVRALKTKLDEQTALMAVVKADGYSHGMLATARAALEGGATWLGVAHPAGALALSHAGLDVPILTWMYEPRTAEALLPELVAAGIDVSVGSMEMLRMVIDASRSVDRRARVHLKIDTGMGRNGVLPAQARPVVQATREDDHVQLVAAWTHLADADDIDSPATDQQAEVFDSTVAAITEEFGPIPLQHLANSAALLSRPDLHRDLVRPGIAMYGYPPVATDLELRPAMTVTSRLALVKEVPAGHTVGYSRLHTTAATTRLGLVPMGYADGLHRAASTKVSVLVRTADGDHVVPQIGRISMDQIVLDLGPESTAKAGDEVILFGDVPQGPTADDWAEAAGTIPYEILTSINARVPREVRG